MITLIVKLRYTIIMALNKSNKFNAHQNRTAGLAKALAHPARIAILEILGERATCICGDITDELPLAQSTVSQHLKVLKESGLIKGEVEGTSVCYCLNGAVMDDFNEVINNFIDKLTTSIHDECC